MRPEREFRARTTAVAAILVLAACLLFADARGSVAPAGLPAGAIAGQLGGVAAASEPIGSRRVVDEQQRLEEWSGYAEARTEGRIVYVAGDGSGDFNILIRTMSLDGAQLEFRAGAGIVADSQPERELAEARAKARGMLLALTP